MEKIGRLALCMVCALLGNCGSDSDGSAGTPVTIKFLRHDNPNYVKADKAFFAEYMAAHPNVKIADTTVDFRTLASSLIGDLTRDQFQYDLVLIPPSRLCGFADHITDVPADVITLAQAESTFFAAPLQGSICDGALKGLPVEYNLEYGGVVVNVDKYQEKFPGKMPGWSDWQSFIAEAAALTEYDSSGRPMANGLDIDPDWPPATREIFLSQILQRGGDYWSSPAKEHFNFRTDQARLSLATMVDWLRVDKVMWRTLVPERNTHVTTRLAAGATGYGWSDPGMPLSVMGYVGTAGVPSTIAQLPPGSNWQYQFVALPPMVGSEHRFVQDSGWAFAVPRTSRNPAVAWDIARSMALDAQAMRSSSAITGALPALKENGSVQAAAADPVLARVQPLLEHGQWVGFVPVGAFETVSGAFVANFFAAVAGTKSIEQALTDLEQTANAAIDQHRGN